MEYNILGPFLVLIVSTQHVFSQSDLNSSLTFVIDDTYSMHNDIDQVKLKAKSIVDTVMNSKESQIKHFVLVTFNDPDVKLVTATKYKKKFMDYLNSIKVQRPSSNDCPEYSLTGIEKAIEESRPGSYIYVFTDASSKDYTKYEAVKQNAREKGVQIVFFLTGYCKPTEGRSDVYYRLAEDTKGQVFHLHKDELGNVLNYVKEQVKSRKIVIASKKIPTGVHLFDYTVDGNMKEVVVSIAGVNADVRIRDPQDKEVKTEKLVNTSWITIVKVIAKKVGVYHANVKSGSDSTVEVSATNTLHFQTGFSRFKPKAIEETETRPLPDIPSFVFIKIKVEGGFFELKTVQILDMSQNIIEEIDVVPLPHTNQLLYVTSRKFTPPNDSFRIAITGLDARSHRIIKRHSPVPVEPEGLAKMKVPATIDTPKQTTKKVAVGSAVTLECHSHGYPEPDIKWIFYSTYDRSKPFEILRNERQRTLKLPKIQATQQGYYVCEASNIQGTSNITYNITVLSQREEGDKPNVLYDTDCNLNIKTEFLGNTPLMLSSLDLKHSSFKNINGILSIPANARILLGCPKGFMKFSEKKFYVKCNQGTSFIMTNGSKYDFSDLKCKEEIQPLIKNTGKTCKNDFTELLKIGYDLADKYLEVYEVCFDKKNRVPLYAKQEIHKPMTGIKINNPKWYKYEYNTIFDFDQMYDSRHVYRINDELNKEVLPNDCSFSKRQLVDPRNVLLGLPQAATFSYLNVVPHWSTCNQENWDLVETKIRRLAETRPLHVWTGISSEQLQLKGVWKDPYNVFLIDENKNEQPIPRYLWKVVLDSSTMESLAIIQLNIPDTSLLDVPLEKYVMCPDICSRIKWMNDTDNTWHRIDKGYTFCCNVKDFAVWFGYDFELFNSSGKLLDVA